MRKFALAVLVIWGSGPVDAAQKIKYCGTQARMEVARSLDFLQDRLETILANVGDLTNKEKRKLRRKIDRVNIKCFDHKKLCDRADLMGVRRHMLKKAVGLCYNNIRAGEGTDGFCELTEVLMHEMAHAASVDKASNHNDGPNGDRVYRTGWAAGTLCRQSGVNGTLPWNTNN